MEEFIFKKFYKLYQRFTTPQMSEAEKERVVLLEELKNPLQLLARCLCADDIVLLPAEREGGCSGLSFYLPSQTSNFSTRELNRSFYLFRICYLYVQRSLKLNWTENSTHTEQDSRAQSLSSKDAVLTQLFAEFPQLESLHAELLRETVAATKPDQESDLSMLYGRWMNPSLVTDRSDVQAPDPLVMKKNEAPGTELEAGAVEELESYQMNKKKIEEYTLSHSFEKAEAIEEFQGHWRDTDGSDELAEHEEALRDLKMRQTVRTDDVAHSVFRAELNLAAGAPEISSADDDTAECLFYPEWDAKQRAYKHDYCRVFVSSSRARNSEYTSRILDENRSTLNRLRRQLALLYNDNEQVKRQPKGEQPDLDEVVDAYAEIHAKRTPSENVYLSRRKRAKDISLLILADSSLSTDAYTDNRRVIDIEKQAILLFGEALEHSGERFQVDSFSSHTRNHCIYQTLKSFNSSWIADRNKVGAMEPHGYTRIGPALRHAVTQMAKETARHRWIVILSDGKPNDYDRYEGRYGIEDVRQAIREANQQHVHIYALAVEAEAKHYFPRLFGSGGYRILPNPALLPDALMELYTRLAH